MTETLDFRNDTKNQPEKTQDEETTPEQGDDNKKDKASHLMHLGVSGSAMTSTGGGFQYRSRPQNHLARYLVDTGVVDGDRASVGGAETAWVKGSISLQGELLMSTGDDNLGNTFRFGGAYLSGSWVLTGKSRLYDRKIGVF